MKSRLHAKLGSALCVATLDRPNDKQVSGNTQYIQSLICAETHMKSTHSPALQAVHKDALLDAPN